MSIPCHASAAPFAIPVAAYLSAHPQFSGVATGALVFSSPAPGVCTTAAAAAATEGGADTDLDKELRVLLIQRAEHDSMPSRWEIPGGGCDLEDETLLHGLARELREEAGLALRAVGLRVRLESASASGAGAEADTADDYKADIFLTRRGRLVVKFTFIADVDLATGGKDGGPQSVVLDPKEHQRFLWATEEECRARRAGDTNLAFTTERQRALVLEGFRLRREVSPVTGVVVDQ